MNHGRCKRCWWWKWILGTDTGRCYMHNGDGGPFVVTKEMSYCPDYINRKKQSESLDDFIFEVHKKWD